MNYPAASSVKSSKESFVQSVKTFRLSGTKIFIFSLFILLIILISYVLFYGKSIDTKPSHLTNNTHSNDMKKLLEDISDTLKSIEILIGETLTSKIEE